MELRAVDVPNDLLSRAEERLIDEIYQQYGYRNRWDLVDNVMHKLPEWTDPHGSSTPIHIRDILVAVGEGQEEITAIYRELRARETADEVLSRSTEF